MKRKHSSADQQTTLKQHNKIHQALKQINSRDSKRMYKQASNYFATQKTVDSRMEFLKR